MSRTKKHLRIGNIFNIAFCGRTIYDRKRLLDPQELTPENERDVCISCLRSFGSDMYPKEFTDTFKRTHK